MAKRDRMLLILVVGIVLVGGYFMFFSAPEVAVVQEGPEIQLAQVRQTVDSFAANLKNADLTKAEQYALDRTAAEWGEDPFYAKKYVVRDEKQKIERPKFTYSGFIAMGKRKMAIINGMEYSVGEELEIGGYVLRDVNPDRVVLEVKGMEERFTVPYEEEVQ